MKQIFGVIVILMAGICSFGQDMTKFKLYDPKDNAEQSINDAVQRAKKEGKHVFIQVGGNWCIWCARYNDFINNDTRVDSIVKASYVVYHLNYSKENTNGKLLAKYSYPQRFGFPVFLILDADGKLLHTQNSWYLEDGKKSYDHDKTFQFYEDWTVGAFDPEKYKEQ